MTILTRIYRQPAALLALAAAVLTALAALGVLTETGATIALGVLTALIGALVYLVTPAAEVVVQQRLGEDVQRAGAAMPEVKTGAPVIVGDISTLPIDKTGEHRRDDTGATTIAIIARAALMFAAALFGAYFIGTLIAIVMT